MGLCQRPPFFPFLFFPCPPMQSMHFSFFKTRNAFCLAFCVALFSIWPRVSKADLTQAQIQAAFVAALKEYAQYSTGEDYFLPTLPFSDISNPELLSELFALYISTGSDASTDGLGFMANNIYKYLLPGVFSMTNPVQRLIFLNPGHLNPDAIQVENEDILHEVEYVLDFLEMFYSVVSNDAFRVQFTTNRLDVSDEVTHDKLDNIIGLVEEILSQGEYDLELWLSLVQGNESIVNNLESIQGILETSGGELSSIDETLSFIAQHIDSLAAADQDADSTFNSAYNTAESDTESQDNTAASDYENIPLSEVDPDDYSPEVEDFPDEDEEFADMGFGDQDVGSHNALIRLWSPPRPRSRASEDEVPGLPDMDIEIDWGRDQVLNSAVDEFGTFFSWLYPIIGTLFLSAKSLNMFRKCKLASEAVVFSGGHPAPIISLAWDPF